jgi:predicted transposase YbfD/YdcC
MMTATHPVSIRECFAEVTDCRREHLRLHNLWDIIAITICAVCAGADSWVEVAKYGTHKLEFLQTFLELPHGIPSHDTFGRVFALLQPSALQAGFLQWVRAIAAVTFGRFVAIDGKTARRSFDKADGKGPLHMVSAWASENRLLLGQQACDRKSNEITAIPELLKNLEISGAIVTTDAMGCQKTIAAAIQQADADYVLQVKDNHPTLHEAIRQTFRQALNNNFAGREYQCQLTEDKGHGRVETRIYHIMPVPEELREQHPAWDGLRSIGMVFSERQEGHKKPSMETRYFISSLPAKVKTFARAVRNHWGIETSLHWVLDVSFREDDSRLRKGYGPENLGLIRRLAVSLFHNEPTCKAGVGCKRKCAGWDDDYLLKVLSASLT